MAAERPLGVLHFDVLFARRFKLPRIFGRTIRPRAMTVRRYPLVGFILWFVLVAVFVGKKPVKPAEDSRHRPVQRGAKEGRILFNRPVDSILNKLSDLTSLLCKLTKPQS